MTGGEEGREERGLEGVGFNTFLKDCASLTEDSLTPFSFFLSLDLPFFAIIVISSLPFTYFLFLTPFFSSTSSSFSYFAACFSSSNLIFIFFLLRYLYFLLFLLIFYSLSFFYFLSPGPPQSVTRVTILLQRKSTIDKVFLRDGSANKARETQQ